jgi:hypothetical protein
VLVEPVPVEPALVELEPVPDELEPVEPVLVDPDPEELAAVEAGPVEPPLVPAELVAPLVEPCPVLVWEPALLEPAVPPLLPDTADAQLPPWQDSPAVQAELSQQGSPSAPQTAPPLLVPLPPVAPQAAIRINASGKPRALIASPPRIGR